MLTDLDLSPQSDDVYEWADFIELRAICHPDRAFSKGDLFGVLNRGRDRSSDATNDNDGVFLSTVESTTTSNEFPSRSPAGRWRDAITFINGRISVFGPDYPFQINGDTVELLDSIGNGAKLYLVLLISASMRYIPRTRRNEVARQFEEHSLAVFEKIMPMGMEVRAAWARGGAAAPYQGTLFEKLQLIAADIRARFNCRPEDFRANDRGDGGIDIVAWHPMGDDREGVPIAMAQCGCSRDDWSFKHLEASPAKLGHQLSVMHPWSTYYFLPQDLRKGSNWAQKSDMGHAIFVDRLRIIRLARQYELTASMEIPTFLTDVFASSFM